MIGLGLSNTKHEDGRLAFSPTNLPDCKLFYNCYGTSEDNHIVFNETSLKVSRINDNPSTGISELDMTQGTSTRQPLYRVDGEYISFDGGDFLDTSSKITFTGGTTGFALMWCGAATAWADEQVLIGNADGTYSYLGIAADNAGFTLRCKDGASASTTTVTLQPTEAQMTAIQAEEFNEVVFFVVVNVDIAGNATLYLNNEEGAAGGDMGDDSFYISSLGTNSKGTDTLTGTMLAMAAYSRNLKRAEITDLYNWYLSRIGV